MMNPKKTTCPSKQLIVNNNPDILYAPIIEHKPDAMSVKNSDERTEIVVKCQNVDFEEALQRTGFGRFNLAVIVICGLVLCGINTESYSIGYILPVAACDLHLNNYYKGILSSASFMGFIGSSLVWGYLSDTRGRKKLLIISLIGAFVTSLSSILVTAFWPFATLRFLNGVFISGAPTIVFPYFGELQPKKQRSSSMAFTSLFIAIALISLPAVGWILLPKKLEFDFLGIPITSWRLFIFLGSLPNFLAAMTLLKLPESPKFLYHSGRSVEALKVLNTIHTANQSKEVYDVQSLFKEPLLSEKSTKRSTMMVTLWKQIAPLFRKPYLKYTMAGNVIQWALFAVSSGLLLWYPDLLNRLSLAKNANQTVTVCQSLSFTKTQGNSGNETDCNTELDSDIFLQNLILGFVYLFSYLTWGFVVNLLGNRNFFLVCMAISSICLFLVHFVTNQILIDILFVLLLCLPGICVNVLVLMIVDFIPTSLCAMGVCLAMTIGRFGSIMSSSFIGVLLEWNCTFTFSLYAGYLIACGLLIFIFPKRAA